MRLFVVVLFVSSLQLLAGCAEDKLEDDAANKVHDQAIVGGYSVSPIDDADIVKAAEFAVAEKSKAGVSFKLTSVKTAKSQVVAGMNYQMSLVVDEAGTEKTANVVVYQDLKGEMSLTSWD